MIQNAKKIGFVVVNDSEEFLHKYSSTEFFTGCAWAKIPDLALVFSTYIKAKSVVDRLSHKRLYVLRLYDLGSHYAVRSCFDSKPKWLHHSQL